ncbi:MAG: amino acid ABC transporter permease, partial [Planctomicrobium sp.]|nr:amino acid ABC transporter permease [Planctomicrobium sp.]
MKNGLTSLPLICFLLFNINHSPQAEASEPLTVGAKAFTESVILANIVRHLAQDTGIEVEPVSELGGTRVVWSALLSGEIAAYPEYTGTIREELFQNEHLPDLTAMRKRLAKEGISMTASLGFNNTYALGVLENTAEEYHLKTISDLKQ